jgi:acyl-coenzyme A thioesterase PaaI-like protein
MTFSFDREPDLGDARHGLAAAMRSVIEELATSSAGDEAFVEARALVQQAAALLVGREHARGYSQAEASLAEHQADSSFLDFSPFIGRLNPLAPPIEMGSTGEGAEAVVTGSVSYGSAYEGPPGCVHGGFIAAGFDEVLGFAQSMSGNPGMTARLTVQYRSPTPLHRPLRFEGRIDHIEGRKIHTRATLHHGDTLCAEAEALFVSMKPEVFMRLMRQRAEPTG